MRNFVLVLITGLVFLSCDQEVKKISWDPFYPNFGVTEKDIIEGGFTLGLLEGSTCGYINKLGNSKLIFYLDLASNGCGQVRSQEHSIDLRDSTIQSESFYKVDPLIISKQDSFKIVDILGKYNSKIITSFYPIVECRKDFKASNNEGKVIEWSLILCGGNITLTTYTELTKDGK